ncbi:MAG: Rrf2 family transcriptional regulator [Bacteroidota bacterium]|nr:Rrf2 family transcriptional regulator [Bacteroidota bacterium]
MSTIFQLSEAVSIGLHGMVLIAKSEGPINATVMAEQTGSSRNHLAKVFQRLVKQKLVKATRGPSGGYILNKKPDEISLLEIYESIEGPIESSQDSCDEASSSCPLNRQVCPFSKCIMNNIVSRISAEFKDYLETNTLRDYI